MRVPNAMDGVPVITQPSIVPDGAFVYQFEPPDAGTFFYHPHQKSYEEVARGRAGALIVEELEPPRVGRDVLWVLGDWRLNRDASARGGDDARLVQGLFMTVDQKRDTPEVLAQYVPAFHPAFLGLYGDPETTARTAKEFKVYFHLQPPNEHGSYSVDHSGHVLVFDAAGRLRQMMKADQSTESMARDLRALIRESEG